MLALLSCAEVISCGFPGHPPHMADRLTATSHVWPGRAATKRTFRVAALYRRLFGHTSVRSVAGAGDLVASKRVRTDGGNGGGAARASQDLKAPAGKQARDACNGARPGKGPKAPPARAQGAGGGGSACSSGGAQDSLGGAH
jgi:hypothetical protein